MEEKQPVVVSIVGMHRSGTSLLANSLAAAGVYFGQDLLSHYSPDNPDGYGEHAEVFAIQENLLIELGREWHSDNGWLPLPTDWLLLPEVEVAKNRLISIVKNETAGRPIWAFKDPRTCRFLPLWSKILAECNVRHIPLVCIRNPDEVAASLFVRNRMPRELAMKIWMTHQIDILSSFGGMTVPVVDYQTFISKPEYTLSRLFKALGFSPEPNRIEAALKIVKPSLRHHADLSEDRETPFYNLYQNMCQAANNDHIPLPINR